MPQCNEQVQMKTFTPYLILVICMIVTSCSRNEFIPQEGDIVFCVAESSAMSDAIVAATAKQNDLQYDHVAIFVTVDNNAFVIEASTKKGVGYTEWSEFLDAATKINDNPGIVVMRPENNIDMDKVIESAKGHIGEPYDWSFRPDNGKMYCSELIYECYINDDGTHLFNAKPMNFRDKEGNMPLFWIELFEKSGESIPEGVYGTNPNDMSKESFLKEVHRYF